MSFIPLLPRSVQCFDRLCILLVLFFAASSCNIKNEKVIGTKAELGELLFFDPILSRDSSISCASCHKPEFAFADNKPVSEGVFHRTGNRNTPSAMNQKGRNLYFWDGRAATLKEQAMGPMENFVEMDFPLTLTVKRLLKNEMYRHLFRQVYGRLPEKELIADALATYEETLETSESVFDNYMKGEDTTRFSESAKRGLQIFNNKGKCFDCHFGVDFTGNDQFRNIGLYNGKTLTDVGRYGVTGEQKHLGAFKTPGLRNVAVTGPYMHNGIFKTLDEVIDYYDRPDDFVSDAINRDSLLNKPLNLTRDEKKDLKEFLLSLTDKQFFPKID
jgi:cytochrome c peroxidase